MALYQPTNIIPSSYTKGTVDAVNDKMEISWQVNGNSAMTAFQIDFYLNDANSTPVTSTGRLEDNCPFYGTDRFGRPQFFTWNANDTWNSFNSGFTNGNEYKYKITQWYKGENRVLRCQANVALTKGNTYYFTSLNSTAIVYFSVSQSLATGANYIYYSYTNDEIWVQSGTKIVLCSGGYIENGTAPNGAIEVTGNIANAQIEELFVSQTSSNIFSTNATPTLTILQTNTNYSDNISFQNYVKIITNEELVLNSTNYFSFDKKNVNGELIANYASFTASENAIPNNTTIFYNILENTAYYLNRANEQVPLTITISSSQPISGKDLGKATLFITTSIGYFTAEYTSETGNPIRWIRWQVATANNGNVGEILADTGDIYTLTLNFEFNGLFNGQQYAIRAIGESESGQECDTGWILFNINIENQGEYSGSFTVQCLNKENATLLEWEGVETIPPTVSPQGYEPTISNGSVTLLPKDGDTEYLVTWDEQGTEPMNFDEPWTAVWKGKLKSKIATTSKVRSYLLNGFASMPAEDKDHTITLVGLNIGGEPIETTKTINGVRVNYDSFPQRQSDGTYLTEFTFRAVNPYVRVSTVANLKLSPSASVIFGQSRINPDGSNTQIIRSNGIPTYAEGEITYLGYIYTGFRTYNGAIINYKVVGEENLLDYKINVEENTITVELWGKSKLYNISVTLNLTYATAYYTKFEYNLTDLPNFVKISGYSIDNQNSVTSFTDTTITTKLYATTKGEEVSANLEVEYLYNIISSQGKLFNILSNNIIISISEQTFTMFISSEIVAQQTLLTDTQILTVIIMPKMLILISDFGNKQEKYQFPLAQYQQPITSVSIYGGDSGATVDSVSIYQGDSSNILSLYENHDFEPVWNSPDYELYMTANFNGNLEGGTGTATGSGFRVYRQEVGKNVLTPIATVPSTTTSIKDYGIVSRKAYKYSLYAYDNNGAFMSAVENEKVVATCFKNYSLLVCDYDEENDEYHVRKQYLFALNLSTGSVGNNNSPTLNANFTRYPTRMPSTQNYASGTLQGLIGAIYTVPALIEQISNYKWTAKPSTMDYFDNVDLEQELYDLSTAPYQLFLRDMKGRLRMIHTSAPITMTTNIKQKQQSISMSLSWVEIGDASDVTIIQTPKDEGWNNDNQVLDVSLDVDVETGELSATYPYPYNGTKFYLTGVNKETLTAKTPLGITPAQFELSETATQPDDGELNATVKVNSEDN